MQAKSGLVLTGGGARAAYQAGVLKGVAEITGAKTCPFNIITGTSAGAINGCMIAAEFNDFQVATERLWHIWENIQFYQVFDTKPLSLFGTGMELLWDLGFGGFGGEASPNHLLSTKPLKKLIEDNIDFEKIQHNLKTTSLYAVSVTAVNYFSGTNIIFYDSKDPILEWVRTNCASQRETLLSEHVLASSSIPVFFPPVRIKESFFGDGGVRQISPFSPAIHFGSQSVLAIGIRHPRSRKLMKELIHQPMESVSFADISGVLLNALFLDSLSSDLERLERINRTLKNLSKKEIKELKDPLRPIEVLTFMPSVDLADLASQGFLHFPKTLRFLLKGLGTSGSKGQNLLSYLTFHSSFTGPLLELGRKDAFHMAKNINTFF